MKKKVSKIPNFKTREEEAKFWDTHSFADYWDEFKDVDLLVDLHKPKEETVVVRLQKSVKDRLEKVARSKGINVSALTRMWLMEKLQSNRN
jgi:hypothetical protein